MRLTTPLSRASRRRPVKRRGACGGHLGSASVTNRARDRSAARTREWRASQRGSASLELVVIFPAVLALIFGAVQIALFFHARNVALAAAQAGARAAAAQHGTAAAGATSTWTFLDQAGGPEVLTNTQVTPTRSSTQATVTVTGKSLSVFPGIPGFTVHQTAHRPVERFTLDGSQPLTGAR